MRANLRVARLFFYFTIAVLVLLAIYITITYNVATVNPIRPSDHFIETNSVQLENTTNLKYSDYMETESAKSENNTNLKYILQYTNPNNVPFVYMGKGQEEFISLNCPYTNCIVTGDENYLGDIKKFDAVAFCGPEVVRWSTFRLPKERSPHQKYVFGTIESSHYYPVCSNKLDGFFNWTWTFRLDSEVRWGYTDIRDMEDNLIGPNKIMHWMKLEDMDPVSDALKEKLKSKTIAAAWFVSNCLDKVGRLQFAKDLQAELKKYNLVLDIYGQCGSKSCPRDKHEECVNMIDKSYYFYLSFENSFSEDYVTEKLFNMLKIDVVPIVYGGANYTRFVPDGAYLNARELGAEKLAAKMNDLINDPEEYAKFFRWKKYYKYVHKHDRPETNEYCKMCEILNDEEQVKKTTIVQNFREWWDSPKMC